MNKIPKRVFCSGDDCYNTVDTFGAVVREDGTLNPNSILCGDCRTKSKKHSLKKLNNPMTTPKSEVRVKKQDHWKIIDQIEQKAKRYMPTLPQKLEAIRAVCVKANPERVWTREDVDCNGKYFDHAIPVVLSDVLAAMNHVGWNLIHVSTKGILTIWKPDDAFSPELRHQTVWNLLHPSLDDQEEATISFIYEILCEK